MPRSAELAYACRRCNSTCDPPSSELPTHGEGAINDLVQPAAVIASHVNEGATAGGKLKPQSRTAAFIHLVKGRPVYPALSERTMKFDGKAQCVAGC